MSMSVKKKRSLRQQIPLPLGWQAFHMPWNGSWVKQYWPISRALPHMDYFSLYVLAQVGHTWQRCTGIICAVYGHHNGHVRILNQYDNTIQACQWHTSSYWLGVTTSPGIHKMMTPERHNTWTFCFPPQSKNQLQDSKINHRHQNLSKTSTLIKDINVSQRHQHQSKTSKTDQRNQNQPKTQME